MRRSSVETIFGAARVVLLGLLMGIPVWAADAPPVPDPFDAFLRKVQRDPGAATKDAMIEGLRAGLASGRPTAASTAARLYLAQTAAPAPEVVRLAGDCALQAGDLLAAVSRYKQYLGTATPDADAANVAATLCTIQLDYLGSAEEAFRFMDENGDRLRGAVAARKFDSWFLDYAQTQKNYVALARRLATILAEQLPLEAERYVAWERLDVLLTDLVAMRPEMYAAGPHLRRMASLIREDPARRARAEFLAANLAYRTGAEGKDDTTLGREVESVVKSAVAYQTAAPTEATLREIATVWCGNADLAKRTLSRLHETFAAVFLAASAADRDAFLANFAWSSRDWFFTPEFWTALALKAPDYFRATEGRHALRFVTTGTDQALFRSLAAVLPGTRSVDAAVVTALAGEDDPWACTQRLMQQQAWHLDLREVWEAYRRVWDVQRQLPRAEKKLADNAGTVMLSRFGRQYALNSPLMLHGEAAREILRAVWAIPDEANPADKSTFVGVLTALQWVPYTRREDRQDVFGPVAADVRQWADQIRKGVAAKDAEAIKSAALVGPLDDALKRLMDPASNIDPATAANPVCRDISQAVLTARSRDAAAFATAMRAVYGAVKSFEKDHTPFGGGVLRWVARYRPADLSSYDLQLEMLADQLALSDGGINLGARLVWSRICSDRAGWGSFNGAGRGDHDALQKLNGVLAKALTDALARDRFSGELFGWFRSTRNGNGWSEQGWNAQVLEQIILRQRQAASLPALDALGTLTLMQLIRNEFNVLDAKYPAASAFDAMYAAEVTRTRVANREFWRISGDTDRKVLHATAEVFAKFPRYPFGWDASLPVYDRASYWEIVYRIIERADAPRRQALIDQYRAGYGKVFFDSFAVGMFSVPAYRKDDPAAAKSFFDGVAAYSARAAVEPFRYGPPLMTGIGTADPAKLADAELEVLLTLFRSVTPYSWPQNKEVDAAGMLALRGLARRQRYTEMFPLLPQILRTVRELRSTTGYTDLTVMAGESQQAGQAELAAVLGTLALGLPGMELREEQRNAFTAVRAKALAGLGGSIPVERGDPRYPVFAAQADYLLGKFATAWELYLSAAGRFAATMKELDPAFVLWVIERHTDVGDFTQAEDLARQMIQWATASGQGFDREVRARLMLAYAGVAKARQEYPKARAMYEQLVLAKEFDGTQAKREAELSVAEVDRLTRQYDDAILSLEKLSRRGDAYLQTEANYQLALIKFDREEFAEAKDHIEKVFVLEPSHVNGRLLEGRVNLRLKKLVEATEVRVGLAGMQEVIVPGRPLKVQLEDRTLAVSGKGGTIEVRAWTDAGDEEFLSLLPFGDSKTKFEGQIPTLLGAAVKGDRLLQVRGGDRVNYDFSERFMRANKIEGSKAIAIRVVSPGDLFVSSGRILSRQEQEELAMERLIRERLRSKVEADQTLLSTVRASSEIKPGNPINVRVVDPDRSGTPERDKIAVRVNSSSGDAIDALELTETEPFSGVFEGQIATMSAPATAFASDAEEGREPVYAIAGGETPGWAGLPDGRRPKTLSIDLNDLVALGKLTLTANETGRRLKRFALQVSHSGRDFRTVAAWPQNLPEWDGAARFELVRFAGQNRLPRNLEECESFLNAGYLAAGVSKLYLRPFKPELSFDEAVGGQAAAMGLSGDGVDSWYVGRFGAAFYLPQRQVCAFRVDLRGNAKAMAAYLTVDGVPVDPKSGVFRGSLPKGVHRVEFCFAAQRKAKPVWTLMSDVEKPPELTPCSAQLFDPSRFPEGERGPLFVPAAIAVDAAQSVFTATFPPATKARTLRLVMADFEGQAPAVRSITLDSAEGAKILPPAVDIVSLRRNRTLEIVPGDRITIAYEDPVPVDPKKAVSEASMSATFNDAQVEACFIESVLAGDGTREAVYIPMRRFRVGDALTVFVNDPDMDVSEKPDQVTVSVMSADGSAIQVPALETEAHSGIFTARVFPVAGQPQRPTEFRVGPGDDAVIAYVDRENTNPGIPWERRALLEQTGSGDAEMRVYSARSRPLTEQELATPVKITRTARMRDEQVAVARTIVAYRPADAQADNVSTTLVVAPLMVELLHPAAALSVESEAVLYVQTARGRARVGGAAPAAAVDGEAAPFDITVPGTVRLVARPGNLPNIQPPVGYRAVTIDGNRYANAALDDGRFSFVLPMELAALPEKSLAVEAEKRAAASKAEGTQRRVVEDEEPLFLAVAGNDTVYIGLKHTGPNGAVRWQTRTVALASDPWLHVMERRYETEVAAVHVGELIFPRVIDHVLDTTDEKEEVTLNVTGLSGGPRQVKLSETFGHSGVFKGAVTLAFGGDPGSVPAAGALAVGYGERLTFEYATGREPAVLAFVVQVHKGADGQIAPFTKQFRDPEIAIQTQFTTAEAYFEMAKKHRELGQKELARKEISQGRKLLEESLRDSPKSEARAHADYLLAELSMQFADETTEPDAKQRHYREAVGRFTEIVANFPEGAYAPKSQFKKALAFEKMGEIDLACEEYVKLSYRYPDNELVAETIARLGNYFTVKNRELVEKAKAQADLIEREKLLTQARATATTAAQVFGRLSERFPDHPLAWKTLVLSGQCYIRAEDYPKAVATFKRVIATPKAEADLIAQSMYWCGDSHMKSKELVAAYRMFKKLTWDYPESIWAKYARGRLSEEALAKIESEDAGT